MQVLDTSEHPHNVSFVKIDWGWMVPACRREPVVPPTLSTQWRTRLIEENLGDIAHNLTDKDDEALMPVDGVTTQKEDQVEEEEAPQEGRVSQMDSIGEDREELPQDSTARVSGSIISAESPPVCASKI